MCLVSAPLFLIHLISLLGYRLQLFVDHHQNICLLKTRCNCLPQQCCQCHARCWYRLSSMFASHYPHQVQSQLVDDSCSRLSLCLDVIEYICITHRYVPLCRGSHPHSKSMLLWHVSQCLFWLWWSSVVWHDERIPILVQTVFCLQVWLMFHCLVWIPRSHHTSSLSSIAWWWRCLCSDASWYETSHRW